MGERLSVRTVALGRWRSILHALGMSERALSGKHCPCPMCGGTDRFRFDDREGRGTYFCSGCGAGDGVQLAMGITGLPFRDAVVEIERIAGVATPTTPKPADDPERVKARLRKVWHEGAQIRRGDAVHGYLAGRGLSLHDLPLSIRCHPGLAYHDGERVLGTFPAMLAAIVSPAGQPMSIHRTYIQDKRKAPVPAPKKLMQGLPLAGAAIRLTPVSRTLGVAEGIETALACLQQFDVPTWACVSAGVLEAFEPPAGVEHVIVFGDHDDNFTGQAAAYRLAHRLARKAIEVEVCIPPAPGDWLDHLPTMERNRNV
ncbi:MAG: toprim domain-containing protein [Rhodocyclaceae bacterium]